MKQLYSFVICLAALALTSCSNGSGNFSPKVLSDAPHRATSGFQLLYDFGAPPDGEAPFGELLAGTNGELYGTTVGGGNVGPSGYNAGTVFEISTSGTEQVLYRFQGGNDGVGPEAGLTEDSKGDLFGATSYGGGASACSLGCGIIFELKPSGSTYTEKVLYAFQGGNDGAYPLATLLPGKKGVFYGTAAFGGKGVCSVGSQPSGCGVVFELKPSGSTYTEKILHSFKGGKDGESPRGSLVADTKGTLYGTTVYGGKANSLCLPDSGSKQSCGVVFSLTPSGTEKVLYRFKGGTDGANSRSALLPGANGSFFGVTLRGGNQKNTGHGTAFELTKSSAGYAEHVIYTFCSQSYCSDGSAPTGDLGLIGDGNGNLYGATTSGGDYNCYCGSVFKLSSSGSDYALTTLHSFIGSDGASLHDSVTLYNGTLYGDTFQGGASSSQCSYGCGTVFKVTP